MTEDAAVRMKARLRADLVAAMKAGRKAEAGLLRQLVAAIDNAEAAPVSEEQASLVRHAFGGGSAEAERRVLGDEEVRAVIAKEIAEREAAIAELDGVGQAELAERLAGEVALAGRYL